MARIFTDHLAGRSCSGIDTTLCRYRHWLVWCTTTTLGGPESSAAAHQTREVAHDNLQYVTASLSYRHTAYHQWRMQTNIVNLNLVKDLLVNWFLLFMGKIDSNRFARLNRFDWRIQPLIFRFGC